MCLTYFSFNSTLLITVIPIHPPSCRYPWFKCLWLPSICLRWPRKILNADGCFDALYLLFLWFASSYTIFPHTRLSEEMVKRNITKQQDGCNACQGACRAHIFCTCVLWILVLLDVWRIWVRGHPCCLCFSHVTSRPQLHWTWCISPVSVTRVVRRWQSINYTLCPSQRDVGQLQSIVIAFAMGNSIQSAVFYSRV